MCVSASGGFSKSKLEGNCSCPPTVSLNEADFDHGKLMVPWTCL